MALNTNALTTVQRVADHLGLGTVGASHADYNVLERYINVASNWIQETYLDRTLKLTTYTQEVIDSDGQGVLFLKHYPVSTTATLTLEIRASAINEDDWEEVDAEDYFVDYETGTLRAAEGYIFLKGIRKYRCTYSAGYDFNNSTTFLADTGAADLEYVMWKLVGDIYNRRKGTSGVKSESIGDYSVTFEGTIFESPEIKEILDKYAKLPLAGAMTPSLS